MRTGQPARRGRAGSVPALVRVLLIVNSFASSVTARSRVVIQKALSADHEVSMVETSRRGHATRFAQAAATRGVDVVVVLGGDGTVNEAANGLAGTGTALAPLPGGSTNVFARTLGYPNDPVEATAVLVDALARRSLRRAGLGRVDGRYFCFHTGVGFDAAVVREVERRASLKRWAGHPLFIAAAVKTWAGGYDRAWPAFTVHHTDGTEVDGGFALVMNTNPYTFLGNRPLDLVPGTGLDTPLAVVTFRTLSAATLLRQLGAALRGTGLQPSRTVDVRTGVREVRITMHRPVPYQVDGDELGDSTALHFRHEPFAISLVVPAASGSG